MYIEILYQTVFLIIFFVHTVFTLQKCCAVVQSSLLFLFQGLHFTVQAKDFSISANQITVFCQKLFQNTSFPKKNKILVVLNKQMSSNLSKWFSILDGLLTLWGYPKNWIKKDSNWANPVFSCKIVFLYKQRIKFGGGNDDRKW